MDRKIQNYCFIVILDKFKGDVAFPRASGVSSKSFSYCYIIALHSHRLLHCIYSSLVPILFTQFSWFVKYLSMFMSGEYLF